MFVQNLPSPESRFAGRAYNFSLIDVEWKLE